MRILVVHNRYRSGQPSGENTVVDREVELLREAGHDVAVYFRTSDDIAGWGRARRAAVPMSVVWSRQSRREVARLVRRQRSEVVHVHNTFPLISAAVLSSARGAGAAVVATLHNYRLLCPQGQFLRDGRTCEDCLGKVPWRGVAHACYRDSRAATLPIAAGIQVHRTLGSWNRNVARFVALTGFASRKLVEGGLPESRISVLPNFAPEAPQREGPGDVFAFVGRLSEEKAPDVLANAWDPSLGRVVFVGDGPLRERVSAALAPHGESAACLGALPPGETRDLIGRARAVVLTSRVYEACPSVIGEAYAAGVPVVAPDFGSFTDLVAHEETGLLFPPGDASGLRACLRRLADDELSTRLGEGARRLYAERFSPERHRIELEAIYDQALEGGASE